MAPLSETSMGKVLLGVATVTASAGFLWMKKIINIEI
jgi:Flp pilus assembly protein TadB